MCREMHISVVCPFPAEAAAATLTALRSRVQAPEAALEALDAAEGALQPLRSA